ncbi:MAG: DUF2782 domain-containing protein [Ahniella sp.]|nr:DUF2782 domain-containing protein [Ahniella sp.]
MTTHPAAGHRFPALILALLCAFVPVVATAQDTASADEDVAAAPDEELLNVDPPRPADVPIPDKIPSPDEEPPAVTIRNDGGTVIEEYRQAGKLTMVRVTPENGITYTYLDTDGDGRLEGDPKDGPVSPVYYTLYEWE